jgi:hypothetical protein
MLETEAVKMQAKNVWPNSEDVAVSTKYLWTQRDHVFDYRSIHGTIFS